MLILFLLCIIPAGNQKVTSIELTDHGRLTICDGAKSTDTSLPWNPERWLRNLYDNCNHVRHHLIIHSLKEKHDISFLSSVQSVEGSVIIKYNKKSNISIPNLKIVYGKYPYRQEGRNISLFISKNHGVDGRLAILDLHSIRSVVSNDIVVEDNTNFCYLNKVNWQELLEDDKNQRVHFKPAIFDCKLQAVCDSKCENKRLCWGPHLRLCQKVSTCMSESCGAETKRCFNKTICCSSKCAGGCTGSSANDCLACRKFNGNSTCLSECYQSDVQARHKLQSNRNFFYEFGSFCTEKCPKGYVGVNGVCLDACPANYFQKNGKCVSCSLLNDRKHSAESCRKRCKYSALVKQVLKEKPHLNQPRFIIENETRFTWRSILEKLINCTELEAPKGLKILSNGASQRAGSERVRAKDLENLRNLNLLYGYIMIDLSEYPGITNLSFLANLQSIITSASGQGLLVFGGGNLQFLGLKYLRQWHVERVSIYKNPKLCYMEHFQSRLPRIVKLGLTQNKPWNTCQKEGRVCDSRCATRHGCWGPGPSMCVACKRMRAGNDCVLECSEAPGYFKNSSNARVCQPCHTECLKCNGPRPDQCIGRCRHVKDGSVCVKRCPSFKYETPKTHTCELCHKDCQKDMKGRYCSGPKSIPGPDGCNFCSHVELDRYMTAVKCCSKCSEGFYESSNPPENLALKLKGYGILCLPCPPNCRKCLSNHQCTEYSNDDQFQIDGQSDCSVICD